MAEAVAITRTVTSEEKAFTLTLTEDEFNWLRELVGEQTTTGAGDGVCGRIWDAMVRPVEGAYTYKGVTYDLTATYMDASGDPWRFTGEWNADGVPLISCVEEDAPNYQDWSLSRLVAEYSYGKGIRKA